MNKKTLAFIEKYHKENRLWYKVIELIEEEETDHETCGYDLGCILHSDTLMRKFKKLEKGKDK